VVELFFYTHTTFSIAPITKERIIRRALPKETEKLLFQFISDRSSQHFSLLYRQHIDGLMRTAMYLAKGQRSVAEDIVQETWVVAIQTLDRFAGKASFKTWLTGILINKFREYQRKNRDTVSLAVLVQRPTTAKSQPLNIDLKNAILQLPDGYREVLTLHDIEGFKHKEIARLLNIKEGTSKSQLFQARKAMRQLLTGYKIQ